MDSNNFNDSQKFKNLFLQEYLFELLFCLNLKKIIIIDMFSFN